MTVPTSAILDHAAMVGLLQRSIAAAGSQAAFARRCGVTKQYINDVLHDRRVPSDAVLGAAGMRRVVRYQKEISNE